MSRFLRFGLPLALLSIASACPDPTPTDDDDDDDALDDDDVSGDDDDSAAQADDDDAGPVAETLNCAPAEAAIHSVWGAAGTVAFTAIGTWTDGTSEDVTAIGEWSVADGPGGEIAPDGTFTAPDRGAGVAVLQMDWEGLTTTCSVETYLEAVLDLVGDPALEAAVAGAATRLSDACAPYVLYPLDGSLIPADFFSPEVQWIPGPGDDTWVITFTTTFITLTAITQDPSWTPSGDAWWAIANPDAGATIDLSVYGGDWDGAAFANGLCASSWPLHFWTAEWGEEGSVFYWTPNTQGLWQVDVGTETATPWMDQSIVGQCVGCHSVNLANPTLLAVTQGNGGYGANVITSDADPTTPIAAGSSREASFSALDPTGTRVVRANRGVLYLDDVLLDQNLATVPTTGWATHPNWSPDGQWLVYASCDGASGGNDWSGYGCHLRVLEALAGDQWGPDTILALSPPGQDYYYPNFSPDSQWIAFNRRTGGADNYDEPTAELMLMPASGGPPTLLAGAGGLPNITNSWPRWGPIEDDIGWIAFGSRRLYAQQTTGNAQVWVAGVDLSVIASGLDGSYAPVWLPGQNTSTGNHTPAFIQRDTD